MRSLIAATVFVMSLIAGAAVADDLRAVATDVRIEREWPLPPWLRWAFDVRWGSGDMVLVAAGKAGVAEFPARQGPSQAQTVVPGGSGADAFFFSARLGSSHRLQLIGSPFAAFSWRFPQTKSGIAGQRSFAGLVDADVHEDRFALLGADRDDQGRWSPDGTIVWTGRATGGRARLYPLFRSTGEPNARNMARCLVLDLGAVRFTAGGALIVVPGVEPGVFLYDPGGRLQRTWRTDPLGFVDRCPFDDENNEAIMVSAEARNHWWNENVVLDELLSLDGDPALILRKWDGTNVTWEMVRLRRDGDPTRFPLPFASSSPYTHLRADLRGKDLLVLLSSLAPGEEAPPPGPRILIARITEGPSQ